MRLIGIPALAREFGPANPAAAASPGQSDVEARHARHRFGRKANFVVKLRRQMFAAPSELGGDTGDALQSAGLQEALKRPARRRALLTKLQQAVRQICLDDVKTLLPVRFITQPVT